MEQILIKHAQAIVTCDEENHVYHNCDLLVQGPEILQIRQGLKGADGCRVIDGTGKIVYPGLVNTHHHLFQSFVRNLKSIDCPNMTLMEWLDKIYQVFDHLDDEAVYYASLTAMADLIKHGCTTAFDLQYCYTPYTGTAPIDRQMEAAAALGIRLHAGRGTNTLPKSKGSTIPDGMCETTEAFLQDSLRLIRTYHDPGKFSMRQIVLAPCQPINCYEETFVEALKLARSEGVRLHTHLGEGETEVMVARTGMRTLDWCEKIGFVGEDVWFAHCWDLNDQEFQRMARLGCGIAHCPEAAMLGGFPILPLKRLKEWGVTVGLGCDGSSTNDGSNLLSCIRIGYLLQAHHSKARGGCVAAYDLLKAATANSARLLGRSDIGSLEPGKAADLFLLDISGLEMVGTSHDPQNLIGRVGATDHVWMTMINGRVVYENGRLAGVDETALAEQGNRLCRALLERIPGVLN